MDSESDVFKPNRKIPAQLRRGLPLGLFNLLNDRTVKPVKPLANPKPAESPNPKPYLEILIDHTHGTV